MLSAEVNNYSIRDLHNSQIIRPIIRDEKKPNSITKLFNDSFEIFLRSLYPLLLVDFLQDISLLLGIVLEYERTFPPRGGGYFRNFWVGMCRWDPGTLNLYQS